MAKPPCPQCGGPRFDPWSGNRIPHAAPKTLRSQVSKKIFKWGPLRHPYFLPKPVPEVLPLTWNTPSLSLQKRGKSRIPGARRRVLGGPLALPPHLTALLTPETEDTACKQGHGLSCLHVSQVICLPCACVLSYSVTSDSFATMDCSPPGSSVCGVFQARLLEYVAISFSKGIFLTQRSNRFLHCRQILHHWVTWKAPVCFDWRFHPRVKRNTDLAVNA